MATFVRSNRPAAVKPQKAVRPSGRPLASSRAAVSASAYSMVSMVQRFGPLMREGGALVSLSYLAAERVIPGYGGGMSSAKAALESDTRTLAFEAGRRFGIRVNAIAPDVIPTPGTGEIALRTPLARRGPVDDVAGAALFLASPFSAFVTGSTLHVDGGNQAAGGWRRSGSGRFEL